MPEHSAPTIPSRGGEPAAHHRISSRVVCADPLMLYHWPVTGHRGATEQTGLHDPDGIRTRPYPD